MLADPRRLASRMVPACATDQIDYPRTGWLCSEAAGMSHSTPVPPTNTIPTRSCDAIGAERIPRKELCPPRAVECVPLYDDQKDHAARHAMAHLPRLKHGSCLRVFSMAGQRQPALTQNGPKRVSPARCDDVCAAAVIPRRARTGTGCIPQVGGSHPGPAVHGGRRTTEPGRGG